jgi:hypothetical protein
MEILCNFSHDDRELWRWWRWWWWHINMSSWTLLFCRLHAEKYLHKIQWHFPRDGHNWYALFHTCRVWWSQLIKFKICNEIVFLLEAIQVSMLKIYTWKQFFNFHTHSKFPIESGRTWELSKNNNWRS